MIYYRNVIACLLFTGFALLVIHYTNLDMKFQSLFFDFETKKWMIDKDAQDLKFILYRFPKYLIVTYGVCMILWLIKLKFSKQDTELQKKLLFLTSVLIFTPLTVAVLKHYSPVHCPNILLEFGGCCERVPPLHMFKAAYFWNYAGKCFPAGHASGGFALISLYFVMQTKSARLKALIGSVALGIIMGMYQIAKGVHFLSDTIATAAIAYLICITMQRFLKLNNNISTDDVLK